MGTGMDDTSSVRGTIVQWLKTSEKKNKKKFASIKKSSQAGNRTRAVRVRT